MEDPLEHLQVKDQPPNSHLKFTTNNILWLNIIATKQGKHANSHCESTPHYCLQIRFTKLNKTIKINYLHFFTSSVKLLGTDKDFLLNKRVCLDSNKTSYISKYNLQYI